MADVTIRLAAAADPRAARRDRTGRGIGDGRSVHGEGGELCPGTKLRFRGGVGGALSGWGADYLNRSCRLRQVLDAARAPCVGPSIERDAHGAARPCVQVRAAFAAAQDPLTGPSSSGFHLGSAAHSRGYDTMNSRPVLRVPVAVVRLSPATRAIRPARSAPLGVLARNWRLTSAELKDAL